MITLDTSIEELHNRGVLSVRAKNVCKNANITTFRQLLAIEKTELLGIYHCGRKTIHEIDSLKARYYTSTIVIAEDSYEVSTQKFEIDAELKLAEKKFRYLSPQSKSRVQCWTQLNFAKLTTRAQNIFVQYKYVPDIIRAIYADSGIDLKAFRKCGKKTAKEFEDFLERFKVLFEELTQGIDITEKQPKFSRQDIIAEEIREQYPFLLRKECLAVADYKLNNKTPILYILYKYIYRNEDPRFQVYKDFYGLNKDGRRYTLDEIAHSQGVSRERIRQIVSSGIPLPDGIKYKDVELINKSIGDIIAFDSPVWGEVKKKHMLDGIAVEIPLLLCSLSDCYTVIQVDNDDICYLVKRKLIENVRVRNVCNSICKAVNARRSVVEKLDILSFIKSDKRKYHRDVKQLCVIYSKFISTLPNVNVIDDRYILLLPNTIDISMAVESILADKGVPMTLQELYDEYNELHPTHRVSSLLQLKSYIFRNKNIRPKGKRGIYVLSHWENQFTGNLTDYIEYVLKICSEPLHIDDIVDFVKEEFPTTSKMSIYSLLAGNSGNRFILYEGNFFGIASYQYNNTNLKEKCIISRKSFDERFAGLKDFVSIYKRLPIASSSRDEEDSLCRWLKNTLGGKIEATEDQSNKLKEFLIANSTIPQNGFENRFKVMCDRIKIIVAQNFALPSQSEHLSEYQWLQKNRHSYQKYEDNRRQYFEDLLLYLKDYGFYL